MESPPVFDVTPLLDKIAAIQHEKQVVAAKAIRGFCEEIIRLLEAGCVDEAIKGCNEQAAICTAIMAGGDG